ncbi:UNVERIFIED_CONTAM: hypothetical protein FKN15_027886 [Acipenser sinensis]
MVSYTADFVDLILGFFIIRLSALQDVISKLILGINLPDGEGGEDLPCGGERTKEVGEDRKGGALAPPGGEESGRSVRKKSFLWELVAQIPRPSLPEDSGLNLALRVEFLKLWFSPRNSERLQPSQTVGGVLDSAVHRHAFRKKLNLHDVPHLQ